MIKIDFSKKVVIKGNLSYTTSKSDKGVTLHINPDKLSKEQIEALKTIPKELPSGKRILKEDTSELLNKLYKYKSQDQVDIKILEFFRDIIPSADLEALDDSLYMRAAFRNKEPVTLLIDDIAEKFGTRGRMIADLCSSNFFEEFFIPLYNNSKEEFAKIYEQTVSSQILAVFVHGGMKQQDIENQVKHKVEASRKYGMKVVRVHGIGAQNVAKINSFLSESKVIDEYKLVAKKLLAQDRIIVLELII